ncbi:nuclear transport factor 2 family protein [Pedobacter hiemivivus]|uniref:Nuclear transport factor 2 family protein n=1 Tax=Pedobacter hiemivivus TaxID=2530454 RepID=A0A4R0NJK6_9SPHI|nr:nuclear transport factor 2 family protein [Pedobacter hiemivivus]TCC99483.1 nuclear transport factor 2 family protein [Pedobacter hiemivivus]TKC63672.1 nuclear transport factor 2 family protein [Pedobacter hiemivivus]
MENKILELEKKYWKAMETRDFDTVRSLTRFPCIVAGKDGIRSVDEPSFKKMFDSGAGNQLKVVDISDAESEIIAEDTAVLAYLVELEYSMEGRKSSGKCACTSTWVKVNKNWVCAMHTESDLRK